MNFQETKTDISKKQFMMSLRISCLQIRNSLPLFESLSIIGKDGIAQRLRQAREFLDKS